MRETLRVLIMSKIGYNFDSLKLVLPRQNTCLELKCQAILFLIRVVNIKCWADKFRLFLILF